MAFQQSDLDALKAAISLGALRVDYGDKRVDYRSLDDMIRTMKLMEAELGIVSTVPSRKYGSFFRD